MLSFLDEDKAETIQPYDDALVVTLRIGGYMKRVLVDQGNKTEIMYPDLYKGLNLKLEDFITYDPPLLGFDGKVVVPRGQIGLHCDGCLFSLHSHCSRTLASFPRGRFFHSAFESEIFFQGPS